MELQDELSVLKAQEETLQFPTFNADLAWVLGGRMRAMAAEAHAPVAIGIWMTGLAIFRAGTSGITLSNEDWLRRKRNTVERFGRSTLRIGLELEQAKTTLEARQGLPLADFAAHGGGFPLLLRGSGCVGAIVVSGLPQREDHALVITAICDVLSLTVERLA